MVRAAIQIQTASQLIDWLGSVEDPAIHFELSLGFSDGLAGRDQSAKLVDAEHYLLAYRLGAMMAGKINVM